MTLSRSSSVAPRLGIIGGGQLAKMLARAAAQLGCECIVLDRAERVPAASGATRVVVGDCDDPDTLLRFAREVDVVTLENEFVAVEALSAIETAGCGLYPTAASMARTQDKLKQKQSLEAAQLAVASYRAIASKADLAAAGEELGYPLVLKTRRNGYDGKGNFTVRGAAQVDEAWNALGRAPHGLLVEAFVPFVRELAVIVTRGRGGDVATYPVVESFQQNHVCDAVIVPAPVSAEIRDQAREMALRAVAAVGGIGSFGVEMFLTAEGKVIINELAPRVHNSGHYSIEGCECSQFENHVRAVFGWPLGRTALRAPGVAMVNLLGKKSGPGSAGGLDAALAVPGAHVHLYGKTSSAAGRKLGHVTALGDTPDNALATARRAANALSFGEDLT